MNNNGLTKNGKLFFAIFPRVSTEAQKVQGRSLEVQTKAMQEAATRFGGEIVANYGGQEHATPDFEHCKMEQLVDDSFLPFGKRKWNAVMFYDHSRVSRDNRKASEYIEILKRNKIRFFTIGQELNLFNADDIFMLSIHTITGQHQASKSKEKSMRSRIEGARQGKFTAGQPPFGRWRDKETGKLHIIKKKKKLIELAAKLYLKEGKGFIKIAKILGMNASVLQRALLDNAGDTYPQFKSKRFGIDEGIPTNIPPLLDAGTWGLIKEEAAKRRVYHPGVTTSERLLCGYLFCYDCNKHLTVQEQITRKRNKTYKYIYYRHQGGKCKSFSVKGELLENLVIKSICGILNNSKKFKEALLKPHPTENQRKSLQQELHVLRDSLERVEKKETNLITKMEEGIKMNGLLQKRIDKHSEDKNGIIKRMEEIENRLSNYPTEKEIESYRKLLIEKVKKLDLKNLTHKQKRQLIEMFCRGGRDGHGRRQAGIYVWRSEEAEFSFAIIGLLGTVLGYIDEYPLTQIDHKEDSVNVEELRSHPSMNSFKAYMRTN